MTKINAELILQTCGSLFAREGSDHFSIRKLAAKMGVAPSVIYYYFADEASLLRSMFDHLNRELGKRRAALPQSNTASEMLYQRIAFQIDNQELIVAVLKYYLHYRSAFPKFKNGFVPDKSALHIEEVLQYGEQRGEFSINNLEDDAKVITHAINGFLLEYYPYTPTGKEKEQLITRIHSFLLRALKR